MEMTMKKIEIYTKNYCPFCHRAKELLQANQVEFIEYDLSVDPSKELEMRQRSGRTSVPEIFVDDRLIGGCDDLFALDAAGKLAETLGL
jgi:glutaredoxin 3